MTEEQMQGIVKIIESELGASTMPDSESIEDTVGRLLRIAEVAIQEASTLRIWAGAYREREAKTRE